MRKLFLALLLALVSTNVWATVAQWVGGDISGANLNTSVAAYSGLQAGNVNVWDTTAANVYQPIPTSLTLTKLKVKLPAGSPGTDKSYTFDIVKNVAGTPTDVSSDCTISGAATSCEITISVALVQQDLVALRCTPAGTPTARGAIWAIEYDTATTGETVFLASPFDAISTSNTRYCTFAGVCNIGTDQEDRVLIPTTGTLKKLTAYLPTVPGGTATVTATVTSRPTGSSISDTAIVVVMDAADTVDSDNTHTATVTAGNSYGIKVTVANTPAASPLGLGIVLTTNTIGEFVVPFWGGAHSTTTSYGDAQGNVGTTGESTKLSLSGDFTWKKMYFETLSTMAASSTMTITLRKNQATDTALTFQLTDSVASGNVTSDVAAAALDIWAIKNVPAGTPGTQALLVGGLAYIAPATASSANIVVIEGD